MQEQLLDRINQSNHTQSGIPLSGLATGVILLSGSNLILDINGTASAILQSGAGLGNRAGRLVSTSNRQGEQQSNLEEFLKAGGTSQSPFIIRPTRHTKLILKCIDVQIVVSNQSARAERALTIHVVHDNHIPDAQVFSAVYDLTPAQQKTISALVQSKNATEAALRMGITRETIKSHLEQIYLKTDTESLPQLMMLIGKYAF